MARILNKSKWIQHWDEASVSWILFFLAKYWDFSVVYFKSFLLGSWRAAITMTSSMLVIFTHLQSYSTIHVVIISLSKSSNKKNMQNCRLIPSRVLP